MFPSGCHDRGGASDQAWHEFTRSAGRVGASLQFVGVSAGTEPDDSLVDGADVHDAIQRDHVLLEAATMALYVAVCLLAALIALGDRAEEHHVRAIALVWGTTIGLALAHLFAFRVAARWISGGTLGDRDSAAALAQLAGAAFVAVLATVPIAVFGASIEFDVVRLVLAG